MSPTPKPTGARALGAASPFMLRTWAALAMASALGMAAAPGHAAPQASECEPITQPPQSLSSLLAGLPQCEKSPNWLVALGEQLLAQQRYAEAAEHLERALLLAPTHLPAALAYAIALAGNADLASALQLLAELGTRPDVPEPLRQQLAQAQQQVARLTTENTPSPPRHGWQHRQSAGLRLGHDNNLLGAPSLSALTLTLPSGITTLPVEPSSLPRPGNYQRTDLRTEHEYTATSGRRTALSAALLRRTSPAAPSANTTQTELVLDTQPDPTTSHSRSTSAPNPSTPIWATANLASLQTQGGINYRNLGLATGWAWLQPHCGQRLGAEWQQRQLLSNPVLSGRYSGMVASWGCTPAQPHSGQPLQWQLSARWGTDHATDPNRPGGAQRQTGARATLRWAHWLADLDAQHAQDTTGYSPILGNNTTRQTTRLTLRLDYHTTLSLGHTQLQAAMGVELSQQKANLDIFRINSASTHLSLRKQW